MTDYDRSKEKEKLEALRAELLSIYNDENNNDHDFELETMLKESLAEDYSDDQTSQEASNNTAEDNSSMGDNNSTEDEAPVKVKTLTHGRSL